MPVRTTTDGIPRSSVGKWHNSDGPSKNQRRRRLAPTEDCTRCESLPRLHRVLPLLRTELFYHRTTTHRPHEKGNPIPLGLTTAKGLPSAKRPHVLPSGTKATRLRKAILPCHGRLGIRRGSRTLTGGRLQSTHQKIYSTTNRLLFSHLHTHGTELRHLRKRTTGSYKGFGPLETPPGGNGRAGHRANRPCQPNILEKPTKSESASSEVVQLPPGLQPCHQTRTGQTTCRPRYVVKTPQRK